MHTYIYAHKRVCDFSSVVGNFVIHAFAATVLGVQKRALLTRQRRELYRYGSGL